MKHTDFNLPAHDDCGVAGQSNFFDMISFLAKHNHPSDHPGSSAKKAAQICLEAESFHDIFASIIYLAVKCKSILKMLTIIIEKIHETESKEFIENQFYYNFDIYIELSSYLSSMIIEQADSEVEKPDDFPEIVSDSAWIINPSARFNCTSVLMDYIKTCAQHEDFSRLIYCASVLFALDIKTMMILNDL